MTEVEQLRKENLELRSKNDLKTAQVENIKNFKPVESGELDDGSYRRWVKVQLPRSKRIVKLVEPDGTNFWQDFTETVEILKRAIRCIHSTYDGKVETPLDKLEQEKKYEMFLKASSAETFPLTQAYSWLTREIEYPEFFRETPSK